MKFSVWRIVKSVLFVIAAMLYGLFLIVAASLWEVTANPGHPTALGCYLRMAVIAVLTAVVMFAIRFCYHLLCRR